MEKSIQSGRVTLKLRRKRKRQAPFPPDTLQRGCNSASSSNLTDTPSVYLGLTRQGHHVQSASCLETDSLSSGLMFHSMTNSENSLTLSNDDVFTESTMDQDYQTRNGHRGNSNNLKNSNQRRQGYSEKRLGVYNVEKFRTHSASAIEDIHQTRGGHSDYANTAYLARNGNYGAYDSVGDGSESELAHYQSDSEVMQCERLYRQRKGSKTSEVFRQLNNATPTSLCSFDSDYEFASCQSTPTFSKVVNLFKWTVLQSWLYCFLSLVPFCMVALLPTSDMFFVIYIVFTFILIHILFL